MKVKAENLLKQRKAKKILTRGKESINFSCGLVVLKKTEEMPEHITENKEEILVGIKGEVVVYVNNKKYKTLRPGSVVYIPPDVKHHIKNKSSPLAKYIYITTPTNKRTIEVGTR